MGFAFASSAQSAAAGTVKPTPIAATQSDSVPKWRPFTAYVIGQQVISPNNDVVCAKVVHTSSLAYSTDTIKWTLSPTYVPRDLVIRDVVKYGADPTGITDSAPAIQAAIDSVPATGGTVFIPAGTYKVVAKKRMTDPLALGVDGNPIIIAKGNLTIAGAGSRSTKLVFRNYGDIPPATNYQIVAGGVFRGSGFVIKGGTNEGSRIANVTIQDLEFDGGAGYTGETSCPANPLTGDGWDMTHKAVRMMENSWFSNVTFERLYLHSWRGEVIYHAGRAARNIILRDSELGDANGSLWCVEGGTSITRNLLQKTASNGIEQTTQSDDLIVSDNVIADCDSRCIYTWVEPSVATPGAARYERNTLVRGTYGFVAISVPNLTVRDNIGEDCTVRFFDFQGKLTSLDVSRNRARNRTRAGGMGCLVATDTGSSGVRIIDNHVERTAEAVARGHAFTDSYSLTFAESTAVVRGNTADGTQFRSTNEARTSNLTLTTTDATKVVRLRAHKSGLYQLNYAYRVANGTTLVEIYAEYFDLGGTLRRVVVEENASRSVGSYPGTPVIVECAPGSEAQHMCLQFKAGSPNTVFVTASITEL